MNIQFARGTFLCVLVALFASMLSGLAQGVPGTLSQAVNNAPGGSPTGVAVGQLRTSSISTNVDVVIANYATNQVGVLLGNGNGTFQPMVTYSAGGTGLDAVTIADVNGDGIPDLVVATQSGWTNGDGTVGVLLGNGDGTFQAVVNHDSGGTNPNSITNATLIGSVIVADMNKDGKPDIVVSNQAGYANGDGTVGILLGNGDGTFQAVTAYDSGGVGTDGLAVADLLGLGYPDVVVANYCGAACGSQSGSISVLLNVIATPGTLAPASTYTTGGPTSSVALGDLDGNGTVDVVAGLETYGTQIFLNTNGDGLLSANAAVGSVGQVTSVAIRDVNGDGSNDLIIGLGYCNVCDGALDTGVAVSLNNGNATFQPWVTYDAAGVIVTGLAFGDLNGDGTPDLAAVSSCDLFDASCGGNLAVFLHNPAQAVTSVLSSAANPTPQGSSVVLTDTVGNPGGLALGAGTVTFYDGTTVLSTAPVAAFSGSNNFTYSWTPSTQGTHYLAVTYSAAGSAGVGPESSTAFLAVTVNAQQTAQVPNVVGLAQAAATTAITGAGLTLGTVTQQSSTTVTAGLVISESPAAGTSVNPGSAVSLVVSTGPPQVVVPNVVGDTQAAATTAITGAGLTAGTVTTVSSSSPTGTVVSQSPAANTSVSPGSAVNLTISAGLGVASVSISESVTVSDGETFPDAFDAEAVHVNDAVFVSATIKVAAPVAEYSYSIVGFTSSGSQILTVSNIGQAPLMINSVTGPSGGAFSISTAACSTGATSLAGTTLPPGGACNLTISYTPPATGAASDSITFLDNAALSNVCPSDFCALSSGSYSQTIALSGGPTSTSVAGGAEPPAVVPISISEPIHVVDAPRVLESIVVSPAISAIQVNATESFTATGIYNDGSTQDLTSSVTWKASPASPALAATMKGATATGVRPGQATITASFGTISGSATLTVTATPIIRINATLAGISVTKSGYAITISVTNTGDLGAASVGVPKVGGLLTAILGPTAATSVTPATNVAPGGTGTVTLIFPASAGAPLAHRKLIVGGTATTSGGNVGALWVLTTSLILP